MVDIDTSKNKAALNNQLTVIVENFIMAMHRNNKL